MARSREQSQHGARNDSTANNGTRRPSYSPWRLLPVVVLAVAIALVFVFDLHHYLSYESLQENREALLAWRDQNYMAAAAGFVVIYAVATSLSVPGAIWLSIAGGFLFGALLGALYVVIGATTGAALVFLLARYALGDYLRGRTDWNIGRTIHRMEEGFRQNALNYLLVLRLIPIFPFWVVNLVPAFLGVPLRTYLAGTFFGIIPGSLVYASLGNGLGELLAAGQRPDLGIIFDPEVLLPLVGLATLALLPVAYRKYRARHGGPPGPMRNDNGGRDDQDA